MECVQGTCYLTLGERHPAHAYTKTHKILYACINLSNYTKSTIKKYEPFVGLKTIVAYYLVQAGNTLHIADFPKGIQLYMLWFRPN